MSDASSIDQTVGNRSEQRIPRLRARGRENRRKLLRAAERLLANGMNDNLRFSDVFEAAGVSRGSAYRIYIGFDDLMQDLSGEWINNFVKYLGDTEPETPPENWMALSDFMVYRGAQYWMTTKDTLRVMPRIRSNVPASYKSALRELARVIGDNFKKYFVIPDIPHWGPVIGFYVQLCDITYADSMRRDGRISDDRLREAQALCRTYLSFYFPAWLPQTAEKK